MNGELDEKRMQNEHIVARYLANQLSQTDAERFEEHYLRNPDAVREIERDLRLKEGLAVLRDSGELDALVRGQPRWARPLPMGAALAAALAICVVGVALWRSARITGPIVGVLAEISSYQRSPSAIAGTYVLATVRGESGGLQIPLPADGSPIELRMIPSARTADLKYRVTLNRLEPPDATGEVGRARGLGTSRDGFVTAYLDSTKLQPGRYVLELIPERADPTAVEIELFPFELR
jgi:hypothetical protein